MEQTPYHNHLANWLQEYIADLAQDIPEGLCWAKQGHLNTPGWTLMHLVAEGELALGKLQPGYQPVLAAPEAFLSGADGQATAPYTISQMLEMFRQVYQQLDQAASAQIGALTRQPITDEELKGVLQTEMDYYLHILVSHVAMHCDALAKWRRASGIGLPYESQ